MKKYILILSIAVIAVLNFTLVKSKTGDITLKSITELSQANADETYPDMYGPWIYLQSYTVVDYIQCPVIIDQVGHQCDGLVERTKFYNQYYRNVWVWINGKYQGGFSQDEHRLMKIEYGSFCSSSYHHPY